MPNQECKVCTSPNIIRDMIERMRAAGISYRDCQVGIKAMRDFDISHMGIQRHEALGHFSVDAVLASAVSSIVPEDLNVKTIVTHKLKLWWLAHRDEVPNSKEMREWMELVAKFASADEAAAKADQIRRSFMQPEPPKSVPATILEND